jgi:hypothetical protein
MPSTLHEVLIEMFRYRPSLAAKLLVELFGVDLPAWQRAQMDPGDLTELVPTEYRADAVVTLNTGDRPVLAVVVEAQLGRDDRKRYSWPVYLATLRARLRCPTVLLVMCPDPATAGWCATPIELGHPGWVLRPLVLGPATVPVVTDDGQARRFPELAVLSAMAHGGNPEGEPILRALLAALDEVDQEHLTLYTGVVMAALPAAARRHLEAMLTTTAQGFRDYGSDFVNRYVNQGRAEAEGDAVLKILAARGIGVTDHDRERITSCRDLDQLGTWISRAATADSIDDVFA